METLVQFQRDAVVIGVADIVAVKTDGRVLRIRLQQLRDGDRWFT
jgi:hypothetical protein